MSFTVLSWLFVVAVIIHNTEEAICLPAWSKNAGRWHRPVATAVFRFAVLILTILAVLLAVIADVYGEGSLGAYLLCGYALAMLGNVLVPHVIATISLRRYMPGTASAVLFIAPITILLINSALTHGYIQWDTFLWAGPLVVLGIIALIPLLFWLGGILYNER